MLFIAYESHPMQLIERLNKLIAREDDVVLSENAMK